jgi:hypothetical protein
MAEKFPKRTKELEWTRAGDFYILIDKEKKKTYSLDAIAFMIWIQCDGKTSIEEMTDVFSVNGNRDIVKAAITGILEKLKNSGLIEFV